MQASINAIRQRSSSLAWRFIRSNKINVDYSFLKVDDTNRRCISNKGIPTPSATPEENNLPLVKSITNGSSKFDFIQKHFYSVPPDEVLVLFDAVHENNSSLVRNLIKFNEKIDVDYAFPPLGNTVLHLAASKGYMDIVRILIDEGHASYCKNLFDIYPIHGAAQNNHIDLVEYFSDRCPEMKALLVAVQQKNASLVRSLVKSDKVDVDYIYPMEKCTALHVAAAEGSLEIVKILVEEGHAVSLGNEIDDYPIHEAALNGHVDIVRYLAGTGCSGSLPGEMLDINYEKKEYQ